MIKVQTENLRMLFDQTPEIFCILSGSDHVFEYVNQAHIKALGFDATGKTVREAQPESIEVHGLLDRVIQSGVTEYSKEIAVTLGSKLRYFDLTYAPKRNAESIVDGIMILGTEVTDRVEADDIVRRANQELERILMQVPAAVAFLKGDSLVCELANDRYLEIIGKGEWMKNKAVRDALPELEESFHQAMESVYRTGEPFIAQEYPATLERQGKIEIGYFSFSIEQIMGPAGVPEGIVILGHEVTEQVKLRQVVEQNLNDLQLINDMVPQIIWTADSKGALNYANPRWTEYSGSTNPSLWSNFVHPDDAERVNLTWTEAILSGESYETEFRIKRIDGLYRWFLVRALAIKDSNGKIAQWCGSCTDIEEQRQIVVELKKEREARDQFVSMLSHDLRNPLSAAKISAQLINRVYSSPEKLASLTSRIVDNLNRANKMIENLLDANRIRAGLGLDLQIEAVSLIPMIEDVLIDLGTVHGDRFVVSSNQSSIKGFWSPEGLRRVIENLCNNSVKYGDETTSIQVRLEQQNDEVMISVHNYGKAISPEDQKKLFDPYQRTVNVEQESVAGWGLGLTLVRGVIQAHFGEVEVQSNEKDGTTFRIRVPSDARKRTTALLQN